MSPKLPRVTARELLGALRKDGWLDLRQRGSHLVLTHPDKPGLVVIPLHAGKGAAAGTLRSILRQAGLSADDLQRLL